MTRAAPGAGRAASLVPVLVAVGLVVAVMGSLGAPLLPTIAHDDGVSLSRVQWLLTIFLLAGALATPIMGRLGDGPRRREVILASLSVVLLGSVLAAVSHGFVLLLVARAMQGVGFGLMPVTMTVARHHLPAPKASSAIAALSITTATGAGLGYPITGLLAEHFDYHAAFWFGTIVSATALVAALVVVPKSDSAKSPSVDWWGGVLLSASLLALLVALSEGAGWGWTSTSSVGLFVASVVGAALWVRHELAAAHPLVELRLVRHPAVLAADVIGVCMSVALYLFLPMVVEFVQIPPRDGYGFGASVLVAGLVLVPLSVGTFVASKLAPRVAARLGASATIAFGAVVCGAAMLAFAVSHGALWEAFVATGLGGVGIGSAYSALPALIIAAVPAGEMGSAMGFYQVLRSIGLSLGSALAAAFLAAYTAGGAAIPGVGGYRVALIAGAVFSLLAVPACAFGPLAALLRRRRGASSAYLEPAATLGNTALAPVASRPEEGRVR